MPVSLFQEVTFPCPRCGREVQARVALVVHADEHPDLMEGARQGDLHRVTCPACGHTAKVDAPLLLYRPGEEPPIMFFPAQRTTEEQDREHAAALLAHLRNALGAAWQEAWVEQGVPALPQDLLPLALTEGWQAAQKKMEKRRQQTIQMQQEAIAARQALNNLPSEERARAIIKALLNERPMALQPEDLDDEFFRVLEAMRKECAPDSERAQRLANLKQQLERIRTQVGATGQSPLQEILAEAGDLGRTLVECLSVRSPEEHRAFLEAHPELYAPEGLALLERLVAEAPDPQTRRKLSFFLNLHRRAREVGLEQAFAELTKSQPDAETSQNRVDPAVQQALAALPAEVQQGWAEFMALRDQAEAGQPHLWQQALERLMPLLDHPQVQARPLALAVLSLEAGIGFARLYELSSEEALGGQAERFFRQALRLAPREQAPYLWATVHHSLGILYSSRYERSGDEAHARAAEQHYRNALEVRRREVAPADWAMTHHSLGNLYLRRYERSGDEAHARAAEQHYRNALEVRRREVAPAQWATVHHSLGILYSSRYERSGDEAHARAAEQHYRNALEEYRREVAPADWAMTHHNLGNLYSSRYERSGDEAHAQAAEEHYRLVLEASEKAGLPAMYPFRAALGFVRVAFRGRRWGATAEAGDQTLQALQTLVAAVTGQASKRAWLREAQALPARHAYALVRLGRLREAVEALEADRAFLLREALEAQARNLKERAPRLAEQWEALHRRLEHLYREARREGLSPKKAENIQKALAQAREERARLLEAIRRVPGLERFLLPPTWEDIRAVARRAPLLYLLATEHGGLALWVPRQGEPRAVDLPGLTTAALEAWLLQKDGPRFLYAQLAAPDELLHALERLLPEMEKALTPALEMMKTMAGSRQPIADSGQRTANGGLPTSDRGLPTADRRLPTADHRPLILIPIGRLALLPWHALFVRRGWAVAYAPSAWVLQGLAARPIHPQGDLLATAPHPAPERIREAQRRLQAMLPDWRKAVADRWPALKAEEQALLRLWLGREPTAVLDDLEAWTRLPPKEALYATARLWPQARMLLALAPHLWATWREIEGRAPVYLRFAEMEARALGHTWASRGAEVLLGGNVTRTALQEALPRAQVLHLSTHGVFVPEEPEASGVFLSDGLFSLRDWMNLPRPALENLQLVVLSACQTAIADFRELPQEAIGLPAGFLFAGVPGVVGSLWPVDDRSTALLMLRFYEYLWGEGPGVTQAHPPAEALALAQRWLQDQTYRDLDAYLEAQRHYVNLREVAPSPARMAASLVLTLRPWVKQGVRQTPDARPYASPYHWAGFLYVGMSGWADDE